MTQAKATHFHSFWTRKILAPTESIDDFKEVTAAEKAKLEAADAAWERPPQVFIDDWNTRADFTSMNRAYKFGQYNEETGYFELNTILDIDYPEARSIMQQSGDVMDMSNTKTYSTFNKIRTLMPVKRGLSTPTILFDYDFNVQIYQLFCYYGDIVNFTGTCAFYSARELQRVFGELRVCKSLSIDAPKLTEIHVVSIFTDDLTLKSSGCPLLSLESINYTIDNSTKTLTIILHPDAYARITDEMFEKAAAKGITITSA